MSLSVFFFFQAEDGIRDGRVTGVQTCALPIYEDARIGMLQHHADPGIFIRSMATRGNPGGLARATADVARSEERRVGKECRSRWWAVCYRNQVGGRAHWSGIARRMRATCRDE